MTQYRDLKHRLASLLLGATCWFVLMPGLAQTQGGKELAANPAVAPLRLKLEINPLSSPASGSAVSPDTKSGAHLNGGASASVLSSRNVYSADAVVHPLATVEGDFVAIGGRVVLDQYVKGDAMLAAGAVAVRAPVGEDLRIAGADVSVESAVGGELFVTAASISIAKTAKIAGLANLMGGAVVIDGDIAGPLNVRAKSIVLNSVINGDARLIADQIELGPQAKITGTLRYRVSGEMNKDEAAIVGGAILRDKSGLLDVRGSESEGGNGRWFSHMGSNGSMRVGLGLTYFALLACAAFFLLAFPGFFGRASVRLGGTPGPALLAGIVTALGLPMLAALLFVTILGIPLGLLLLACYPFVLLIGYVVGVFFIARRAQAALLRKSPGTFWVSMVFFALALLLIMLLRLLPFVGPVIVVLLTIAGIGSGALELFSSRRSGAGPALPVSAPVGEQMQHI